MQWILDNYIWLAPIAFQFVMHVLNRVVKHYSNYSGVKKHVVFAIDVLDFVRPLLQTKHPGLQKVEKSFTNGRELK